ncbi:DUF4097 family beta strand repeat-containing protein [Negadavirga shengliensis]|uniref:DUF4097 family beta strand repeat-containing protein n=1 Tax=Negadavirga shengliensis TaxID=1389218 RepID=A0ABV9T4P5_9BACT
MKTDTKSKENKIWDFYFPNKIIIPSGKAALTLVAATLFLTSCLDGPMEVVSDIQEEFTGIDVVEVDAAFLEATYAGDPDLEEIQLDAFLKSTSSSAYEIVYQTVGNRLIVKIKSRGTLGRVRSEGYIHLTGPESIKLSMVAGSGKVLAENVVNDVTELQVGSGKVEARNITADEIHLTAGSGEIYAEYLEGDTEATVSSGKLGIRHLEGNLHAEASSGRMDFYNIHGFLEAKLSSGKIEMDRVEALGSVVLSSGQVGAKHTGLSEYTFLKTSSGKISIQTDTDLSLFNYDISTGSGKARVGESQSSGSLKIVNGSAHTIKGEVSSGTIEIYN